MPLEYGRLHLCRVPVVKITRLLHSFTGWRSKGWLSKGILLEVVDGHKYIRIRSWLAHNTYSYRCKGTFIKIRYQGQRYGLYPLSGAAKCRKQTWVVLMEWMTSLGEVQPNLGNATYLGMIRGPRDYGTPILLIL